VHGGGFVGGSKDDVKENVVLFADKGFLTVSLNYRLVDSTGLDQSPPPNILSSIKITDQLEDIADAVNSFQSIATSKGITIGKLFMAGHSAGGTLAMLYVQGHHNGRNIVQASANLAGLSSMTVPKNVFSSLAINDPQWLNRKELVCRLTGKEIIASNLSSLKELSANWVAEKFGGRPNISIMPLSNDEDIQVTTFISTIKSAESFHDQLIQAGIRSAIELMDTDHDFEKNPGDWEKAVSLASDFFGSL